MPTSSTAADEGQYSCPSCPARLGTRKAFRRHLKEKCARERLWGCPDCGPDTVYPRKDRLVQHHKKRHHMPGCDCKRHLANAEVPLPSKSAFGCVYCVKCFDKSRDLTSHLIDHMEDDDSPPASNCTHIRSLLQHPRIGALWQMVRGNSPMGHAEVSWPVTDRHLKHLVACLERQQEKTDEQLHSVLETLLEQTVEMEQFKQLYPMHTTSIYCDPKDIDETYGMQSSSATPFRSFLDIPPQSDANNGLDSFTLTNPSSDQNQLANSPAFAGSAYKPAEDTYHRNTYVGSSTGLEYPFNNHYGTLSPVLQSTTMASTVHPMMRPFNLGQVSTVNRSGHESTPSTIDGGDKSITQTDVDTLASTSWLGSTSMPSRIPNHQQSGKLRNQGKALSHPTQSSSSPPVPTGTKRLKRTLSDRLSTSSSSTATTQNDRFVYFARGGY